MLNILLILSLFNCNSIDVCAANNLTFYARVMADNVYLYKNPIEVDGSDYANIHFELPKTFFVELLDSYDSNYFLASYMGVKGYVKKEEVQCIEGVPNMPYLNNLSFRVYNEQSKDMRMLPTLSGGVENHVTYVQLNSQNLTFFGTIVGESLTPNRPPIWFYCKYTADKDYFGYVYADYCDDGFGNKLVIPVNHEEVVYTTSPDFSHDKTNEVQSLPVESKSTWIVIAVLSVPAIIFLIMILKSAKIGKSNHVAHKEVKDY